MPYELKLNKQTYYFPLLEEIPIDLFVSYSHAKNDLEKLEILMDSDLSKLPATPKVEKELTGLITLLNGLEIEIATFLGKSGKEQPEITDITILDTPIKFTKNLGKLPYWPMVKVKEMIKAMGVEPFNKYEHYKQLVGHYSYCYVTKLPYDEYKADDYVEEVIGQLPFTDVIRLGDFFLFTQHRSWMRKTDYYKTKLTLMKSTLKWMFSTNTAK